MFTQHLNKNYGQKNIREFYNLFSDDSLCDFNNRFKKENSGIDWTSVVIGSLIGTVSYMIGTRIKNKGEIE